MMNVISKKVGIILCVSSIMAFVTMYVALIHDYPNMSIPKLIIFIFLFTLLVDFLVLDLCLYRKHLSKHGKKSIIHSPMPFLFSKQIRKEVSKKIQKKLKKEEI